MVKDHIPIISADFRQKGHRDRCKDLSLIVAVVESDTIPEWQLGLRRRI